MYLFILAILIIAAIIWWARSDRGLSPNERGYLRRRGYEFDDRTDGGPPVEKDARLNSLVDSLGDVTAYSRQRAAEEIAQMCVEGRQDDRMLTPLLAALGDSDPAVRGAVAMALGNLGNKRAIEKLEVSAEQDESIHVRAAAGRALEKLVGDRSANRTNER
jgi:HEAT repeats